MAGKKGRFYSKHVIEKSLRHHLLEWIATILTITGALFIASKYVYGFYTLGAGNILWIIFAYKYKHYGLLFMNLLLLVINIFGIINW